jgi:hypothetical protein
MQALIHVLVDASVFFKPQGKICLASLIFALSKTTNLGKVIFSASQPLGPEVQLLVNKIPRGVSVEVVENIDFTDFFTQTCTKLPKGDFVLVYASPLFLLPDSLSVGAAGIVGGNQYIHFEEILNTEPGIINFAARYWKSPSYQNNKGFLTFMTNVSLLQQDQNIFLTHANPFEILDMIRGRKTSTPMPSLATSLPIEQPHPMINWQATISMIEQALI